MVKATRQLALDYFSGELVGIRNDIKAGKIDPMQPLADYIAAFQQLPEDRVAKLPDFVSLFSTLCDILDYKIQAFKAMVFEIGKDKLAQFYQDPEGLDKITSKIRWLDAVEFTVMSRPFIADILAAIGRERKPIPACEVLDDAGAIQASFDFPVEERNFFQEKAEIVACLREIPQLAGISSIPIGNVLDLLEIRLGVDRMKAFIHVLHLIQDGELVMQEDAVGDGSGGSIAETQVRLWRNAR